jgi:prepilin-type N-terminal cleavage/methylation domain-containing protein
MSRALSQRGFTLIEVMVAALLMTVALTGLSTVLIGSSDQSIAAVQQTQLVNVAAEQLEQVRATVSDGDFDALALSAAPQLRTAATVDATAADPIAFATADATCGYGYGYEILQNYDNSSSGAPAGFTPWSGCPANSEPLDILSGGLITVPASSMPPTCSSTVLYSTCSQALLGGGSVVIDTFVTDTYVGCGDIASSSCPNASSGAVANCPATSFPTSASASTACADARRVIVAVVPGATAAGTTTGPTGGRPVTPLYISTVFTNPNPSGAAQSAIGLTVGASL